MSAKSLKYLKKHPYANLKITNKLLVILEYFNLTHNMKLKKKLSIYMMMLANIVLNLEIGNRYDEPYENDDSTNEIKFNTSFLRSLWCKFSDYT